MKQVTLNIKEEKLPFFLELVKNLALIQLDNEGDSKEEITTNLKEGFDELKLYKEGNLKGTPLKDFLNEL